MEAAYDNRTYLYINGKPMAMIGNLGSVTTRASIPVPVCMGDTFNCTGGSLTFYPCRGKL